MHKISKNPTKKILLTSLIAIILLITITTVALVFSNNNHESKNDSEIQSVHLTEPTEEDSEIENEDPIIDEEVMEEEVEEERFTNLSIAAAGDIMFHMPQIRSAFVGNSQQYNFKPVFEDVAPYFSAADLAIANFETTLGGAERGFSGYPLFNSPDEVADAIKFAGIDVVSTANNHSLDTRTDGLKRTIQVFNEKGIDTVGTFAEPPTSRVLLKEINEIKVAILAYTESTNGLGDQYPADELLNMLNLMEKDRILEDIEEAKSLEADFIVTFMHWGSEYMEEPNETQVEFAQMMAEAGVDLILGSHPHVIQKSEVIKLDDHQTFVIYSLGNFISNQRKETLGDHRELTEDGVIVNIDIEKNHLTDETTITNVEYVPTWVYRHPKGGSNYTYRILPISEFLLSDEISQEYKSRMERSFDATTSKMIDNPF